MNTLETRNGLVLPAIGFGTYQIKGNAAVESVKPAVEIGYRLIDTAYNYENEGAVGQGIKQSSVDRSELIVTSKLPGRYYQHDQAIEALEESLMRLGLDYLDLYLLHWPNPKDDHYVEAWQALIEAKQRGLVKHIGVCNFLPEHLERLENETDELPEINQIELHPRFNQTDMRAYHQAHGIITEAWSPLGRGNDILEDPVITAIAQAHQKTTAQIILRWQTQLNVIPLPKARSAQHAQQNFAIFDFELTAEELAQINQLTRVDGRLKNQDPAVYEEF